MAIHKPRYQFYANTRISKGSFKKKILGILWYLKGAGGE